MGEMLSFGGGGGGGGAGACPTAIRTSEIEKKERASNVDVRAPMKHDVRRGCRKDTYGGAWKKERSTCEPTKRICPMSARYFG